MLITPVASKSNPAVPQSISILLLVPDAFNFMAAASETVDVIFILPVESIPISVPSPSILLPVACQNVSPISAGIFISPLVPTPI